MVIYLRSLVRLCFGAGGTLQTNITGVCQECLQCMDHTGFAQSHGMCFLGLHCLGCRVLCGALSKAGPGVSCTSQVRATWVQVLRYSTRAQTLLGMRFVPFPGLSSSGDQVLEEHTVPVGPCILITSLVSGVPFVSSGKLISSYDTPGRCQPSRIPGRCG